MANRIGAVKCSLWTDPDFVALSHEAQRMYLFLITQEDISLCGLLIPRPVLWADSAVGLSVAKVRMALAELERARFIATDARTEELLVRTYVKHSGTLKLPNVIIGMTRHYGAIRSGTLRRTVLEGLPHDVLARTRNEAAPKFVEEWTEFLNPSLEPSGTSLATKAGTVAETVPGTLGGTLPETLGGRDADTTRPPDHLTTRPSDEVNVGGHSLVLAEPASNPPIAAPPEDPFGLRSALVAGNRSRIGVG